MIQSLAALLFALTAAPADLTDEGWTFITHTETASVLMKVDADPGSPSARRVWTAYELDEAGDREGFSFRSVKSLGEFDCGARKWRAVAETFHSEPHLKGRNFSAPSFRVTEWAAPPEGSVGDLRMAFACPKAAP